jgi:hypothetical protein
MRGYTARVLPLLLGAAAALRAAEPLTSAATGIDETRLRERIGALASPALEGRASGTPGNAIAARLIARAFARAGLAPVGTSRLEQPSAPLDGSGYFQPYRYAAGVARGEGNRLAATVAGRRVSYGLGSEFEPSGISGSGNVSADVVFAGYGIVSKDPARDDYAGLDVSGKVVLLLAGHPGGDPHSPLSEFAGIHHKALFARDHGAAAVFVAAPKESDLPSLRSDGGFADEGLPVLLLRRRVAEEWLAAAGWTVAALEERLASAPMSLPTGVHVDLAAAVVKVEKPSANVVGLLPGSDPELRDEFVIVGGHYDHLGWGGVSSLSESREPAVHPGADDNASGAAGVMALADAFAAAALRTRRSIVFICFSGEELGLYGSAHYIKRPIVPLERTVAMFNLDMVGRLKDDKLTVIGTGTSPAWEALLAAANRDAGLFLAKNESGFGASDQQSFYAAKIPVLFFFTGVHADYHRPSDTPDKINYPGEAKVLAFVAGCLRRLDAYDARPEYCEVAAPTGGTARFRVWFGSIPDYSVEVVGVKIAGVRAESPAQKAGLRAGDVVVKFGGHTVRNVQDYTVALSAFRPGDVVEVVVLRDGSELALSAVLEAPRK